MTSTPQISVLVAVYRWPISRLAKALADQVQALDGAVEVIFLDDATPEQDMRAANRSAVASYAGFEFLQSSDNVGRARARNRLAQQARGRFLLFLDADVLPDRPDFLACYLAQCQADDKDVIAGGLSYRQRIRHGRAYRLHLALARGNELISIQRKQRTPWRYLNTANVLIRRKCFEQVSFDPSFEVYGYEDTEWGIRLARVARIGFVDNPVSHLGLIKKRVLVTRMRASLGNYRRLAQLHPEEFATLPMARWVRRLDRLPGWWLVVMEKLTCKTVIWCPWDRPCAAAFQLCKAMGLTREFRDHLSSVTPDRNDESRIR